MDSLRRPSEFDERLRSAHEKLRKDHVDLLYRCKSLEDENEELKRKISVSETNSKLQEDGKVEKCREDGDTRILDELQEEVTSYAIRYASLENENRKLEATLNTLKIEKSLHASKYEKQNKIYEKSMKEKDHQFSVLTAELCSARDSMTKTTQELRDLKKQLSKRDDVLDTPQQMARKLILPPPAAPPPTDGDIEVEGKLLVPKILCERCSAFSDAKDPEVENLKESLASTKTKCAEIRQELQKQCIKTEEFSNKNEAMEIEAVNSKKRYEALQIKFQEDTKVMKAELDMYKGQLALSVSESQIISTQLADALERLRRIEEENKKYKDVNDIDTGNTPCSFEEFAHLKREIKLLKLEIMNMKAGSSGGKSSSKMKGGNLAVGSGLISIKKIERGRS